MLLQQTVHFSVPILSKTVTFSGQQEALGRHSPVLCRTFIFKLGQLPNGCFPPDMFTP